MISRIRTSGFASRALVFLFVAGLIAAGWWIFLTDTFHVDEIEISGNAFLTDREIEGAVDQFRLEGQHVWFANFTAVAEKLMENPRITNASFGGDFPNEVRLVLEEAVEFATLELPDGQRVVVDRDGKFIRRVGENKASVGSLIRGFSENVLDSAPPPRDPGKQYDVWSGLSSDPEKAGKIRHYAPGDPMDVSRECIRYFGALRLAGATSVDRGRVISGYDYIGLDDNFDLFLSYPDLPPIVMGGFIESYEMVVEINAILALNEPDLMEKYDYIDLHLPEYGRGIILAEMERSPGREWSGGREAVDVAVWKIMAELESRLGI